MVGFEPDPAGFSVEEHDPFAHRVASGADPVRSIADRPGSVRRSNRSTSRSSVSALSSNVSASNLTESGLNSNVSALDSNVSAPDSNVSTLDSSESRLHSDVSALGSSESMMHSSVSERSGSESAPDPGAPTPDSRGSTASAARAASQMGTCSQMTVVPVASWTHEVPVPTPMHWSSTVFCTHAQLAPQAGRGWHEADEVSTQGPPSGLRSK